MLKGAEKNEFFYNEKPRKLIKLNVQQNQNYNQFQGDFIDIQEKQHFVDQKSREKEAEIQFKNVEDEITRNNSQFSFVKNGVRSNKLVQNEPKNAKTTNQEKLPEKLSVKKEKDQQTKVKIEENSQVVVQQVKPKKDKKPKIEANGQSNWQKFMDNSKSPATNSKTPINGKFVALDCEFVKSGDEQLLARISIVSQDGSSIYDSYVHPQKKITDYVTEISGISYAHIKNAPSTQAVIDKVKKILYNKIIVGHTIWKDLEVCGLKDWKGCKAIVDICQLQEYKEKSGKLISLKNLSMKYFNKKIQEGRHSSVEDAESTMKLFLLRKKQILKQFKLIL